MAYTFKSLPTGKVEIYENGKAISNGVGFDSSYASQLGYKPVTAAPAATTTPAPAAPKTTMADYLGTSSNKSSGSTTSYAAPAVKTPTTPIAPAVNYAAPKSDNSAALAKIAELKNQIGIASAAVAAKNANTANNATINPNAAAIKTQAADIQSKINTIKEQLDVAQAAGYVGDNASKEIKYDSTGKIVSAADAYSDYSSYEKARDEYQSGLDKITSDLEAAKVKQKEIYDGLATKQTQLYNTVYAELGLDTKKAKIAEMDKSITTKTAERDQATLDENGKPIAQWLITGDLKLAYDKYNNEITQLTNERNATASEYNIGLDELGKKVDAGMADAKTAASYWDNQVVNLSNQAASYQSQLLAILNGEAAAEKANTPQTEIIEANGRKLLVTYNSQGKIVSKEDLGEATKASSSTGTVNNPSSYDEYQLAKSDPEYANFIATSKGKSDGKETNEEKLGKLNDVKTAIDNVKTGMNTKTLGVDPFGATSQMNKIPGTAGYDFQNKVNNLVSLLTLENMGIMKGVLSDSDMKVIKSASARIDTGLGKEAFNTALTEIETKITAAINKANGASGSTGNGAVDSLRSQYNY